MSDWKASALKRRDTRAIKIPDVIVNVKGKTKKTKRWCKGKAGIEHKPKCVIRSRASNCNLDGFRELICTKCGKKLDTWWPTPWSGPQRPKPAWVTK